MVAVVEDGLLDRCLEGRLVQAERRRGARDLLERAACSTVGDPAPSDWQKIFARVRDRCTPEEVTYDRAGACYSILMCPVSGTDEINLYGRDMTERIRHETGIPVMAVGAIQGHDHVNTVLAAGRADLCAIARGFLADPYMVQREAVRRDVEQYEFPPQYLFAKTVRS